jgi:RNA polymerase sigma-70 factor (ECF subfamily)
MNLSDLGYPDDAKRSPPDAVEAPETPAVRAAVRAVRDGDREAFGRLMDLYQRRLFGLTLMMVRDPEGAEEVTQDAFIRAFTRLDLYDEYRPFYPWLATIAVRLAQNWLRRHNRMSVREGAQIDPECEPALTTDPLEKLIADERGRQLWRSVAALSSGERTAVTLHYRQEMKVSEVAHALGVTSGTVKTLLFRARRKLRGATDAAAESAEHQEDPT